MKKLTILSVMLISLAACSKDDSPSPAAVSDTLSKGEWEVTYYWDSDHEETSQFAGYAFTFDSDGTLSASNGTLTHTGSWMTLEDDSQTKLVISFAAPPDFEEISDDWHVLEKSRKSIMLEDVSGGNGGVDQLEFRKI